MRSMPTPTRQRGQALPHRRIEALDKSRVERHASCCSLQQVDGTLKPTLQHFARHLHDPFLLPVFVDDANEDLGPGLQASSSNPIRIGDFVTKSAKNAPRIRRESVTTDEQSRERQAAGTHKA